MQVEGGGQGYKNDRIIIQFEPGYFKRLISLSAKNKVNAAWKAIEEKKATTEQRKLWADWQQVIANKVEGQTEEYRIFNLAFAIDPEAAMKSCSWGMGQIMGANHHLAGFGTVGAMVTAFRESIENQLNGMIRFIASNATLAKILKTDEPDLADCRVIARFYNGSAYEMYNYHNRIFDAYKANKKDYA